MYIPEPRCHDHASMGDRRLWWAVAVNVLLTLVQIIGGLLSGSLALIADALHNFGDAASLMIALFARKISRKPADSSKTFGYERAELIAALINLTTLVIVGFYLIYEAVLRFFVPEPVAGWLVVIVAGFALVVDLITAALTYAMSKNSVNVKAAFIHNLTDALASVAVMIAGSLIILYDLNWVDAVLTLLIAGYILYQGFTMMPEVTHILMQGKPSHIHLDDVVGAMERDPRVQEVHHVHVWQLDESTIALECHVVVKKQDLEQIENIKGTLKDMLESNFGINHSTLEFELVGAICRH